MAKPLDLLGQRFGKLVVKEKLLERDSQGLVLWKCACDCGNMHIAPGAVMKKGATKSCGCQRTESLAEINRTHSQSRTKVYQVWRGMKKRCELESQQNFANYGGRGITVCTRWMSFEKFFQDMGHPPPGMSIERKDVNGNYEPSNCTWATQEEQCNNRRQTIFLEYRGRKNTLVRWASDLGLSRQTVYWRYRQGWPVDEVLKA